MEFQDNNIVFTLDAIKLDVPGIGFGVTGSNFDNFIINEFFILGEFEPDLLTIDIDLLGFNSVALAEIEFLSGSDCVLVIAVKDELCKLVSLGRFQRDIFFCEETDHAVVIPSSSWFVIFICYLLNSSGIDKPTLSNYIAVVSCNIINGKSFSCDVVINIIVECRKLSSIDSNTVAHNALDIRAVEHRTANLNCVCCTCGGCKYSQKHESSQCHCCESLHIIVPPCLLRYVVCKKKCRDQHFKGFTILHQIRL